MSGKFTCSAGPIYDQSGKLKVPKGKTPERMRDRPVLDAVARQGRGRLRLPRPAAGLAAVGDGPRSDSAARAPAIPAPLRLWLDARDHEALPRRAGERRASTSRPPPARCTRCSARTAPARARSRTSSPASTGRTRARSSLVRRAGRASHSPSDAIDAGIGMVHQHFRLVPPFTVAENIILGEHRPEARSFVVHPRAIERRRRRARRAVRARGRSRARASGSSPSASSSGSRS